MKPYFLYSFLIIMGIALGSSLTQFVYDETLEINTLTLQKQWQNHSPFWERKDNNTNNPYLISRRLFHQELPIYSKTFHEFKRRVDDDDHSLMGQCQYMMSGKLSHIPLWTLTLIPLSEENKPIYTQSTSITSQNLRYMPDFRFEISLDTSMNAGNWLPIPQNIKKFELSLKLYGDWFAKDVNKNYPIFADIMKKSC